MDNGNHAGSPLSTRQGYRGSISIADMHSADSVALRDGVADGPLMVMGQYLPGDEAWLVAERRADGEWRITARTLR